MTGIIDYDAGNIRSVENALKRLGADYVLTSDIGELASCDRLLLPGVGEAGWAMAKLRERGLADFIRHTDLPLLGICLGMQLLCSWSEEGNTGCLGIFSNKIRHFRTFLPAGERLKVPQMGWNSIDSLKSDLFSGVAEGSYVYFVHSYFADLNENTVASTEYGIRFSSALGKDNFMGCQFHPEKSGSVGERILKNFLEL